MARAPRVSIGLAVYNGGDYLAQTLDSILAQTFGDFELVISDNASTDGTEDLCRRYAARDKRIRYSRNPVNIGVARNFNKVFEFSSASYFRWASADDLFAPTSLEECVDVLDNHPEVVLCYPKTVLIDGDGNTIRSYDDRLDLRLPSAVDRFRLVLENLGLANVQYGLIRADALHRTSLFRSYPGSDMVLIAELALYGRFWELPLELFFRRIHEGGTLKLKDSPWAMSHQVWNGKASNGLDLYYLTHRYYNFVSILRSPVGAADKLRLACVLLSHVFRSKGTHFRELRSAGGQLLKKLTPERNS